MRKDTKRVFKFFKRTKKEPEYHVVKNQEVEQLKEDISSIRSDNSQLRRIIKNYVTTENKITHKSDYKRDIFGFIDYVFTYLYSDGNEYKIKDMYLLNPTFKKNENGTVMISDYEEIKNDDNETMGKKYYEYVVDLSNCTFIQTK